VDVDWQNLDARQDSGITDKIAQSLDIDKEYIRANCDVPDIADKLIAKLNGAAHRDGIERWLRGMVALDDYQFDCSQPY